MTADDCYIYSGCWCALVWRFCLCDLQISYLVAWTKMILIELAVIGIYIGLFLFCVLFSLEVDNKMKMTNKTYDVLKWIAQYLLPASGTLYFAIAQIWSLPYGEQIVGTITAIDTFLGALIGISAHNYSKEDQE